MAALLALAVACAVATAPTARAAYTFNGTADGFSWTGVNFGASVPKWSASLVVNASDTAAEDEQFFTLNTSALFFGIGRNSNPDQAKLIFYLWNDAEAKFTSAQVDWTGKWGSPQHILFVYDGALSGTARLAAYVNGVSIGSFSGDTPPASADLSATTYRIGRGNGGYFVCTLAEAALWNGSALGAADAASLYALGGAARRLGKLPDVILPLIGHARDERGTLGAPTTDGSPTLATHPRVLP